jgi:hypothetical protein
MLRFRRGFYAVCRKSQRSARDVLSGWKGYVGLPSSLAGDRHEACSLDFKSVFGGGHSVTIAEAAINNMNYQLAVASKR